MTIENLNLLSDFYRNTFTNLKSCYRDMCYIEDQISELPTDTAIYNLIKLCMEIAEKFGGKI